MLLRRLILDNPLADGLIAYYPMQEGSGSRLEDVLNPSNFLTVSAVPSWTGINGRVGPKFASSSYADSTLAVVGPRMGQQITVAITCKPTVLGAQAYLFCSTDASGNVDWGMVYTSGTPYFTCTAQANAGVYMETQSPQTIVGTYDRKFVRLWVQGVNVASNASTAAMPATAGRYLQLGKRPTAVGAYSGSLRDFAVWNRALSAAEIQRLVNNNGSLILPQRYAMPKIGDTGKFFHMFGN